VAARINLGDGYSLATSLRRQYRQMPAAGVGIFRKPDEIRTQPMKRPRYTRKELLAQCDSNSPRSEEEQAWLDARPVGRESGAVRVLPLSRVRRDLNSIMRRGDTVVVTRRGECMAKLEPIVTIEQMNEAIRRRGASAGVPSHVEADPAVSGDDSLADALEQKGKGIASASSPMPDVGRDSDFERRQD